MTPRERLIAALNFQTLDGPVPHVEMDFRLVDDIYGQRPIYASEYSALPEAQRRHSLACNADLWIRTAKKFGMCAITGTQWLPLDAQIASIEFIRELSGDTYLVSACLEDAGGLPVGSRLTDLIQSMRGDEDALLTELDRRCNVAIGQIHALAEAGAGMILICCPKCRDPESRLSREDFQRFLQPCIKRQVEAIHNAGVLAVAHAAGAGKQMLEYLIDCGVDGVHAADTEAIGETRASEASSGRRLCLMGSVETSVLERGDTREIEEATRRCLDNGPVDGTGYVFSSTGRIGAPARLSSYLHMLSVKDAWERSRLQQAATLGAARR